MTSDTSTVPTPPSGKRSLALASGNRGKVAEFEALLGGMVAIMSLSDLGLTSPDETGLTFEENAILKARYVHDQRGMITLADDSGLEVDALDGAPGVRSARYAGAQNDDAANRALLLRKLNALPDAVRTARFVAALAIIDMEGNVRVFRGTCEGSIAREARGSGGFGYDSLFQLADGRTMAELPAAEKNAVSHRAQALRLATPAVWSVLARTASNEAVVMP